MLKTHKEIRKFRNDLNKRINDITEAAREMLMPERVAMEKACEKLGHRTRQTRYNVLRTRQWEECAYCDGSFNHRDVDEQNKR